MSRNKTYNIAVIPGDGIGPEVMAEGVRVLDAVAAQCGFAIQYAQYDYGCARYRKTGRMMPEDGLDRLRDSDAILFGAVGAPDVPDHISVWELILPIRRAFDQYINLRPVRLLPGLRCPLRGKKAGDIDFVVVRENTEGEYSRIGGSVFEGSEREIVIQESVFTRVGVDRVQKYAFELAEKRPRRHVTSATKSNGLYYTMPFWDQRFRANALEHPGVKTDQSHIDILAARFVMAPEQFDVVVCSNLFGDILSDLGAGLTGTIGTAPGANINPQGTFPSMFEPIHGSAPDIAGKGIANPIAQIWSVALMLEQLGEQEASAIIVRSIEAALESDTSPKTPDLGGHASTRDVGTAILSEINRAR